MSKEEIIKTIKESRTCYLIHVEHARKRLQDHIENMTAQQIAQETIYIQDMESRAYALMLLLEEIEEQ